MRPATDLSLFRGIALGDHDWQAGKTTLRTWGTSVRTRRTCPQNFGTQSEDFGARSPERSTEISWLVTWLSPVKHLG